MLTGSDIREKFLRFFESKGHRRVHSSSLVPANDPTLLFTNAGMNQFKDVFLGLEKRDYNRATTSQKCVRAGGKHNDLENVGFTKRHHTFFEMLGNFSFGDYFKKEAIAYAWELITSKEWFGIDTSKLYFTIFQGEQGIPRDDEAEKYWLAVGAPKDRIFALGMKDNFWAMGDTGPCGPCSEIYYDMGVAASEQGHPNCAFPCDCGRYVEFWNLVFMQFDRDATGTYNPLPKPSVDTGMGLERVSAILQGVLSNYETDLFTGLIKRAWELTGQNNTADPRVEASLRVIADHARASAFLICDDVVPSNEGRGYVLRKIMRRAIRHGKQLGAQPGVHFMARMAEEVAREMGIGGADASAPYPELMENLGRIQKAIIIEEDRFWRTLDEGLKKLEQDLTEFDYYTQKLAELKVRIGTQLKFDHEIHPATGQEFDHLTSSPPKYSGFRAFKLYDTFGLPFDFIMEACRDAGVHFDVEGFERAMSEQRERARASWKGGAKQSARPEYLELSKTVFEGYTATKLESCSVRGIFKLNVPSARELLPGEEGEVVSVRDIFKLNVPPPRELLPGEEGEVVLDRTPFYADSGGQVGDVGWFYSADGNVVLADVLGCHMPVQGVRFHKVKARQRIEVGDLLNPVVNAEIRQSTMRNHTATHLLHAALREVLGKHVKQAGSLVDPQHLRFDFSHFTGVADEELQDIEDIVNKEVLRNIKVETIEDVPIDVAVNEYKAMALFGEKYGERVRVVRIGGFSTELCGGTHTAATGEIGLIKVLSEGSVSSGVRRVEAISGEGSLRHFRRDHQLEHVVATLAPQSSKSGSPAEALRSEWDKKEAEIKKLQKELEHIRMKSAASNVASVGERAREVRGVKVVAQRVDNLDRAQMRTLVDNMRNKLGSGVVVLGSAQDGKVALIVGVTADLTSRVQAGKIIKPVAEKVGGSGGGRPDMAEAGGKDPAQLDAALNEAYAAVEGLLS